ncbi:hypothetical protein F5Y18DRAFT_435565 [Xylariaceae sp. FL1019]|nr:hypothetical protein F5Y18DRAFT_435565 [Xylariaceae sp. FL1019]
MADTVADKTNSKWSDEEKIKNLTKLVGHMIARGGTYRLADIDWDGRTIKAMTHFVNQVKKDAIAFGIPAATATPTKAQAKGKNKRKAADDDDEEGDDTDQKPAKTPAKRARKNSPTKPKKVKKVKTEEANDSDGEA